MANKEVQQPAPSIRFILCLANEMFSRDSFLAYRPAFNERFTVLGIAFVCVNGENRKLPADAPVIGEIASYGSRAADRETLVSNSFMQLSPEEVKEINTFHAETTL